MLQRVNGSEEEGFHVSECPPPHHEVCCQITVRDHATAVLRCCDTVILRYGDTAGRTHKTLYRYTRSQI